MLKAHGCFTNIARILLHVLTGQWEAFYFAEEEGKEKKNENMEKENENAWNLKNCLEKFKENYVCLGKINSCNESFKHNSNKNSKYCGCTTVSFYTIIILCGSRRVRFHGLWRLLHAHCMRLDVELMSK